MNIFYRRIVSCSTSTMAEFEQQLSSSSPELEAAAVSSEGAVLKRNMQMCDESMPLFDSTVPKRRVLRSHLAATAKADADLKRGELSIAAMGQHEAESRPSCGATAASPPCYQVRMQCLTPSGSQNDTRAQDGQQLVSSHGDGDGGDNKKPPSRMHVRFDPRVARPWSGRISVNGRRQYVGPYATAEEAARAVDLYLLELGRPAVNYVWRAALEHERATLDERGWVCLGMTPNCLSDGKRLITQLCCAPRCTEHSLATPRLPMRQKATTTTRSCCHVARPQRALPMRWLPPCRAACSPMRTLLAES